VLGAGSEIGQLLGPDAVAALGGGADRTNLQLVIEQARRLTGGGTQGKELQAEMLQRHFGLQSNQQAAARQRHGHRCAGRRPGPSYQRSYALLSWAWVAEG
jgi:hypothetical protein